MAYRLSKSKLQSHAQCEKRLWLELHAPQLADVDDASQMIFDRGNAFGEAVRTLFTEGELIDTLDTREALARTGVWHLAGSPTTKIVREQQKQDLLDYCNQDTAIMIDAWHAVLNYGQKN